MKSDPFPHSCGRVLDINWISATRVNYNCTVCGELIAWSDLEPEKFNLKVEINITDIPEDKKKKKEKIYPAPENAQYNPFNVAQWK
jgi:hypothetical protein